MPKFSRAAKSYIRNGGEERYLGKLIVHFRGVNVEDITSISIRSAALLLYPEASAATLNRQVITPCRAVLYHAHELGWRAPIRVRRFKVARPKRPKPATRRWLERFLDQCDEDNLPHLAALVLFMNQTGARVSEAIELRRKHVDLTAKTALLVKTKTDSNSLRHMPDGLVRRIRRLRVTKGSARVFGYTSRYSVNERIQAVCLRAGIAYKSTHTVGRHSFATNALNAGINVKAAMTAGGWKSSVLFLETYAHMPEAGRQVAECFNQLDFKDSL